MSKKVHWIIQTSEPGKDEWYFTDETYSGWFHSFGDDPPTEALLRDYDEAVQKYHWLDVRLLKEVKSSEQSVVKVTRRND